jgi:hypothetical protein
MEGRKKLHVHKSAEGLWQELVGRESDDGWEETTNYWRSVSSGVSSISDRCAAELRQGMKKSPIDGERTST